MQSQDRLELWATLFHLSSTWDEPWICGRDFNLFEYSGTSHQNQLGIDDFNTAIQSCDLQVLSFTGNLYTWEGARNGRMVFKHMDHFLVNCSWMDLFSTSYVTHLNRTWSDHSPILLGIGMEDGHIPKCFSFQQMWLDYPTFLAEVRCSWSLPVNCMGIRALYEKLKRLKMHLREWNRHPLVIYLMAVENLRGGWATSTILQSESITGGSTRSSFIKGTIIPVA
ncbi:hypothetical protein ACH5RR_029377 [Cinchona calisaya]|uniref:Uncharacterized protein n=1 Tax=Cinchona calisaya TaxID=153742 RepID=A0ABD2YRH3_9GENT